MANPEKIIELSGEDWGKGISQETTLPVRGIFQTLSNYNPFLLPGYLRASVDPETVDNTTLSTQVKTLAAQSFGGVGYVFAIGNRSGTGTKCFYRIKTSDNTVSDFSSAVATNHATGAVTMGGLAFDVDGGQVVYSELTGGNIRRVLSSGSGDANIFNLGSYNSAYPSVFFRGAQGYYYVTTGLTSGVVKGFSGSGASWTTSGLDYTIQTGMVAKDGCNDSNYNIIIGDTNPTNVSGVNSECGVFFFLPGATTWSKYWPVPDQYLIAIRQVGGRVYMLGASGIWEVSIGMAPQLIFKLSSAQLPSTPHYVDVSKNVLYWVPNTLNGKVHGFGSETGGRPVLFTAYDPTSSTPTCMANAGNYVYVGDTSPKVTANNYGTTRNGGTTAQTVISRFPQSFTFAFARVTLKKPLETGESVTLSFYNSNSEVVVNSAQRTYSGHGALRSIKFDPTGYTTPINSFDGGYISITASGGAIVESVRIYGYPNGDDIQTK